MLPQCDTYLASSLSWMKERLPSSIPAGQLIERSVNGLNSEALAHRHELEAQSWEQEAEVQRLAADKGLVLDFWNFRPLPWSGQQCLSQSLKFISEYRTHASIQTAAHALAKGADRSCAQATLLYHRLFECRENQNLPKTQFLDSLREVIATRFNLSVSEKLLLQMPVAKIFDHLLTLPQGEYLVCLEGHIIALVMEQDGRAYVYDPDAGTAPLTRDSTWFLQLLRRHQVHLSEQLSLLKMDEGVGLASHPEHCVKFEEEPPRLSIEKSQTRFTPALFQMRGRDYPLILDQTTGYIYSDDSKRTVRIKCTLLTLRTPLDATLRTLGHIASTLFKALSLPLALVKGKTAFLQTLKRTQSAGLEVLRAPFFGILCMGAALYGIVKPFEGRALYSYLERSLNGQSGHVERRSKYYSAPCFIPWNFNALNVRDEQDSLSHLKKAVLWREGILATLALKKASCVCCR